MLDSLKTPDTLRLAVFLGMLIGMSILEAALPRKTRSSPRQTRWLTNLGFAVIDGIALRVFVPLAAIGAAAWANQAGFGILNRLNLPNWAVLITALLVLDMALYWQHVATHKIPLLWRLHKVHHADRDLDTSSGVRFHPIEICLSMVYKMGVVVLLGVPVVAVLIFEIILNACALFNHANLRVPLWLDRFLRIFIVTPDYHRVHHSVVEAETNSNYGFSLTLWDHLFRSYTAQPSAGHDNMLVGLAEHQDNAPSNLIWSLALPFKR